jgi:predicted DsbA family dithiol-disulfide isomerase
MGLEMTMKKGKKKKLKKKKAIKIKLFSSVVCWRCISIEREKHKKIKDVERERKQSR